MKKFKSLIIAISIVLVMAIALPTGLVLGLRNIGGKTNVEQEESDQQEEIVEGRLVDGIYYAGNREQTGANEAPITEKGAIYVNDGATVTISEDAVISGHESLYGGAIYVAGGGTLIVDGGIITNNTSRLGGAIYVEAGGSVEFKKENASGQATTGGIITGNYSEPIDNAIGDAGEQTAAVYAEYGANIITPENCSISDNIPQYYGNYITFDIDGTKKYAGIGYSIDAVFSAVDMPVDYEHCCGYFTDESLEEIAETETRLEEFHTYTTSNHRTFKMYDSFYTRRATLDKLSFRLNDGGQTYSVGQKNADVSGVVVIPREYNGKSVTTIKKEKTSDVSFYNNKNLTEVVMPSSLTEVGIFAFYGCTGLESVVIPASVTKIDDYSFYACSGLESVVISNNAVGIGDRAFYDCNNLSGEIIIPDSVKKIGAETFANCEKVTSLVLGASVESIGQYAFYELWDLVELVNKSQIDMSAENWMNNGGLGAYSKIVLSDEKEKGAFETVDGLIYYTNISLTQNSGKTLVGVVDKNITSAVIADDCTQIGNMAFYGCEQLESVTIPSGVTSIGTAAFYNCKRLSDINIPDTVTKIEYVAFANCNSLTGLVLPNSVTEIGMGVFVDCKNLETVNIPYGVTIIKEGTFNDCDSLTEIIFPETVEIIENDAFSYCDNLSSIYIPGSVKSISRTAFKKCPQLSAVNYGGEISDWFEINWTDVDDTDVSESYLDFNSSWSLYINNELVTSVIIPYSVSKINSSALNNCISVTDITIPYSVTSIGSYAFSGCSSLVNINIPNSVTSIDDYVFYGCNSLANITIPESVTSIGNYAFSGCSSIANITIPNSVTSIGNYAFSGCSSIVDINIPDSVENIGERAFSGCGSLTNISLSQNLQVIAAGMFSGCISLEKVVIPDSVTKIDRYAFGGCSSLVSVTIGSGVEEISSDTGNHAFSGCSNLVEVINKSSLPISIENGSRYGYVAANALAVVTNGNGKGTFNTSDDGVVYYQNAYCSVPKTAIYLTDKSQTSITIDYDCFVIRNGAFRNTNLTSVTIEDNVTTIGSSAFSGCKGLTSVTIPSSVTNIGSEAFMGCTELLEVINLSSLNIVVGSSNHGYAGYYAVAVLTDESYSGSFIQSNGVEYYQKTGLKIAIRLVDDSITALEIDSDCTEIRKYAFSGCTSLTSVTIPYGVLKIGERAFSGCTEITQITIPNSVNIIEASAFSGCTSLTSVTIPSSVTQIGGSAFYNPNATITVNYLGTVDNWLGINVEIYKNKTFWNSSYDRPSFNSPWILYLNGQEVTQFQIPSGVTKINFALFYNCKSITSVIIPSSVTSVMDCAFYGCSNIVRIDYGRGIYYWFGISFGSDWISGASWTLYIDNQAITDLQIPSGVTNVGYNAFYGCTGLANVTIGDSVTKINADAFYGCTGLTEITIPSSVTSIGGYAFYGCTGLTSVTLTSSVTSIGGYAFYNYPYNSGAQNISINYLGTIENWLQRNYYINGCNWFLYLNGQEVTDLQIPSGVTNIGDTAFYGCKSLTSVTIPSSVTSIGSSAFYDCSGLIKVTIGQNVREIGKWAFYNCSNLAFVVNKSSLDITVGSYDYGHVASNAVLVLPEDIFVGERRTEVSNDIKYYVYGSGASQIKVAVELQEDPYDEDEMFRHHKPLFLDEDCTIVLDGSSIYSYIPDGVLAIGRYAFYGSAMKEIVIPDSVLSIGYGAFEYCDVERLTIGTGVTSIDSNAFLRLDYLKEINFNATNLTTANNIFKGAGKYSDGIALNIGENVTSIPDGMFNGIEKITSVTIPSGVTSIGQNAFYECVSLEAVYFEGTITDWMRVDFGENWKPEGCDLYICGIRLDEITHIDIPDTITTITEGMFSGYTGLKTVTIPDTVTVIERNAFEGCSSLESIIIPETVTEIGDEAFADCTGLTEIIINTNLNYSGKGESFFRKAGQNSPGVTVIFGDNVTDIPDDLFVVYGSGGVENIPNVIKVVIGENVQTIGEDAFGSCAKVVEVVNKSSVDLSENSLSAFALAIVDENGQGTFTYADDGAVYYSNDNVGKTLVSFDDSISTSIIIGDDCEAIKSFAFLDCKNLTSVTIPDGYTEIAMGAFFGCTGLTSFNIPSSVQRIGSVAFAGCSGLGSITIPNNVTSIGSGAFWGCSSFESLTIPESVLSIGSDAFAGCTSLTEINYNANIQTDFNEYSSVFANAGQYTGGITFNIGENVTYIPDYLCYVDYHDSDKTMDAPPKIIKVVVGSSVQEISDHAFDNCGYMLEVVNNSQLDIHQGSDSNGYIAQFALLVVDDANKGTYTESNGVLYYSNTNTGIGKIAVNLVDYTLTNLVIDNDCVEIRWGAFNNCQNIVSVIIPDSVTTIGFAAFGNCSNLETLTIGSGVTTIDGEAFYDCCKLKTIYYNANISSDYSSNNYIFHGAGGISGGVRLIIGDNVTYIPSYLFGNTYSWQVPNIVDLTIGANVEDIGDYAFTYCTKLTSLVIPDGVTSIGDYAFKYCSGLTTISIPNSVTSIGYQAFYGCSSLFTVMYDANISTDFTSDSGIFDGAGAYGNGIAITIGSHVTRIPAYLFYSAGNYMYFASGAAIMSVTISASVQRIGSYAFGSSNSLKIYYQGTLEQWWEVIREEHCYSDYAQLYINNQPISTITHINLSNITSISSNAFVGFTGLISVSIPSSVTSISAGAFSSCSKLEEIRYGGDVNDWINIDFGGQWIYANFYMSISPGWALYINNDSLVTSVTISGSVTAIPAYAFYKCTSLTSVTIQSGVTKIGDYAFYNTQISSITIPEGVTEIGNYSFYNTQLTSVTIPSTVVKIGIYAFTNASAMAGSPLTSVTFENKIGWYVTQNPDATSGTEVDVSNSSINAQRFINTFFPQTPSYAGYYWKRNVS